MRAAVVGVGAVGGRVARQLLSLARIEVLTVLDSNVDRAGQAADSLGEVARAATSLEDALEGADVVVLAAPGPQRSWAEQALEAGVHVVSTSDDCPTVRALLDLDPEARERNRHVVAGAGFSPGMTCVLAAHAASAFDRVDEVHVAKVGTGGPACARQHHQALRRGASDWVDGGWARRRPGSGRQLCWFPDPVRAVDCYRAALPEPLLMVPAFPGAERVTARVAANRRDRLTARLPMLRRPHPEGMVGAVRIEVRGRRGNARDERVLGAVDRPGVAAATVAALAAVWAAEGRLVRPGAAGLAVLAEPVPFLGALAERGVRAAAFRGGERQADAIS